MILVTVGAQMPFDRLVAAVDRWAGAHPGADILVQIGTTDRVPRNLRWVRFLDPDEFRRRIQAADAVVSHAGMGTILVALEYGKPLVVMPRLVENQETRNDHQVATAERFRELGKVHVARDAAELAAWLDRISELRRTETIAPHASAQLLDALRSFVWQGGGPPGGEPREGSVQVDPAARS